MIPKFRAWWKSEGKMITNISWFRFKQRDLIGAVGEQTTPVVSFDEVVLMQSTGLFDKNGVEIYVGDIVKVLGNEFGDDVGVVKLESGTFCLDYKNLDTEFKLLYSIDLPIEVIGNIYENPELVQQ